MVNFLLRKIFRGILTEVISLVEIDRFLRKIFLKRKLTIIARMELNRLNFF